jgi:methylated-DNA-[protein]-cysteine S-methyltransferase
MSAFSFMLFNTAVGRCGIGWGERGVACVQLPEANIRDTQKRLCTILPGACQAVAPKSVEKAITGIAAVLGGQAQDLSYVDLDMQLLTPFYQRVYEITRKIPPGVTVTYGEIAIRLNSPGAARAVGQALGRNPFAIVVPCHRVLAANGKLGGFSAHGGTATKRRLLAIEGALDGQQLRLG